MPDNNAQRPDGMTSMPVNVILRTNCESSVTDNAPKVRVITLGAKKSALFCKASNELIADGMSFERMLVVRAR